MTVSEDPTRLQDEEALPLMMALQLETGGSSSSRGGGGGGAGSSKQRLGRVPLLQRLRGLVRGLTPELLAIALVYFVQGILKLSSLAVTFFLKDNLHMEPAQMALAETISALPWTVKPLYGFITDSFPIAGMRRRPYLILAGLLGSAAWLCMAGLANSVPSAIACITAAALSTAFSDVVADSIVVGLARASPGATEGALQSMCWGAHAFGRVITAYLSGWLVGKAGPRPVFVATATFPLIVCASSCLIHESPGSGRVHSTTQHDTAATGPQCQYTNGDAAAADGDGGDRDALLGQQQQQLHSNNNGYPASVDSAAPATAGLGGGGPFAAAAAAAAADPQLQGLGPAEQGRGSSLTRKGSAVVLQSGIELQQGGQLLHHSHHNPYSHIKNRHPSASATGTPTAAAAAAAADDGGVWGLSRSSSSGGGVKGVKGRGCLAQSLSSVGRSVGLFWGAVRQPHMLRPVVFLFLMQAMPQPDSAMFFFKTNVLGFDAEFFGRVKLVAALADLAGLCVYNSFLKSVRLRPFMLWGALLGCAVGLTPLLLVEGVNRKLGVSDRLFAMVDSAILASIGQVLLMPTLVLCARLCPEGVEATLYASLMSLNNAAVGVSSLLGALMMRLFGISSHSFNHLSLLLLTCNLMSLLPLPLVGWVPDSSTRAAAGGAGGAAAGEEEGWEDGRHGDMEAGTAAAAAAAAAGASRV